MGIFGDIAKAVIGVTLGGPVGGVIAVVAGDEIVEGSVDIARQIVRIGGDVYTAIPPWAIALGGNPLHGLLKHIAEDEIIMLGSILGEIVIFNGIYWPVLGPAGATLQILQNIVPLYVTVGSLIGKIHHRLLNDQEWEMAQYIFRGTLIDRKLIILTNLGGIGGRAFVYPNPLGYIYVNLGRDYLHNQTIINAPVLFHELTHVWQARKRILREIFIYDALREREYDFAPGSQWSNYNLEQQASIVEAWTNGYAEKVSGTFLGVRDKFAIGSPLFRYINGNVRTFNNGARTNKGSSVRELLAEGDHQTMRDMHREPPPIWW